MIHYLSLEHKNLAVKDYELNYILILFQPRIKRIERIKLDATKIGLQIRLNG